MSLGLGKQEKRDKVLILRIIYYDIILIMVKNFVKNREPKPEDQYRRMESLRHDMEQDLYDSFEHIEDRHEAVQKIQRICEHSLNDGVQLGKQMRLTTQEWQSIFSSHEVLLKHGKEMLSLKKSFSKNSDDDQLHVFLGKMEDGLALDRDTLAEQVDSLPSFNTTAQIDRYYTEHLKNNPKTFKPLPSPEGSRFGRSAEGNARDYLAELLPALKGQYYSGGIFKQIYDRAVIGHPKYEVFLRETYQRTNRDISFEDYVAGVDSDPDLQKEIACSYVAEQFRDQDDDVQFRIMHESILSPETFDSLVDVLPETVTQGFEKHRYKKLDVVYAIQKNSIEKPLLEDLQRKVKEKYGEQSDVMLENGVYTLAGKEHKEGEASDKQESISICREDIFISPDEYSNLLAINDKLVYKAQNENGSYSIIYDGKSQGEYASVGDLVAINDKLAYSATNENGSWSIIYDGKSQGGYTDVGNPVAINDKIAYKARNENGSESIIYDGEVIYSSMGELRIACSGNYIHILDLEAQEQVTISIPKESEPEEELFDQELLLLNTVHNPDVATIESLLGQESIDQKKSYKERLKEKFATSKQFAQFVTYYFQKYPQEFMSHNSVKAVRARRQLLRDMRSLVAPDLVESERRNRQSPQFNAGGADYLSRSEAISYRGGDPLERKEGSESIALQLAKPLVQDYVSTGYYAKESDGSWKRAEMPLDNRATGLVQENTITTTVCRPGSRIQLPLPIHSSYVPDSIKVIARDGSEQSIEIDIDSFGMGSVVLPAGFERCSYGIQESLIHEVPSEMDQHEFNKTKAHILSQENGKQYFEKISGLPDIEKNFIASINNLEPQEKIKAIESYVQEIGYYDFDNRETINGKKDVDSSELFYVMESRMSEIKSQNADRDYSKKRFAGVCDDYSKLTTALLREAGIPSGLMTGFRSGEDLTIDVNQAHATSFVLWRGPRGNITSYVVDGTPTGMNQEEQELMRQIGINPKTLEEKIKENEEIIEESQEDIQERIQELQQKIENLTPESLSKLSEQEIEQMLNLSLAHTVTWDSVQALERVLSAYKYSPMYTYSVEDQVDALRQEFMRSMMRPEKTSDTYAAEQSGAAGSAMLQMTRDFLGTKDTQSPHDVEALRRITAALDSFLSEYEKRAMDIITKYHAPRT